ncbi:MAG: hypothetical protein MRK02_15330 [Candidatus Scalindua sp.]|nr:hypothetical protein [Candidatus Scalindua sp.]
MKIVLICLTVILLFTCPVLAKNSDVVCEEAAGVEQQNLSDESTIRHFKNGMNSCFLSLLYSPLKVNVSLLGGIAGGLAYPLSGFNADVSKKIWSVSMGGTYLITEDILTGKEELELFFKRNR